MCTGTSRIGEGFQGRPAQHRKLEASSFCGLKEKCHRFMAVPQVEKPDLKRVWFPQ